MTGSFKKLGLGGVILAGVLVLAVGLCSSAIAKPCSKADEPDTGKRVKCKMENLNDAFDGVVTTALGDDTGAFSEEQKQQLAHLRDRARSETERTAPMEFKQLGKKRKVECVIQEILGDVMDADDADGDGLCDPDEGETCIGNEDGICDENEQVLPAPYIGGCAEALGDGKGNEDGICEFKGASGIPKEACLEICDEDVILKEEDCAQFGDKKSCNAEASCKWDNQAMACEERGVDRGRADDLEQALDDTTAVLGEANIGLKRLIQARRVAAKAGLDCQDPAACSQFGDASSCEAQAGCMWDDAEGACKTSACEQLRCLVEEDRTSTAETIRDLAIADASLLAVADACRDVGDQTIPIPFTGGSIDVRIACIPLGLAANGVAIIARMVEALDDSETAERLDATAACAQEMGGEIQEVRALLERARELLLTPQGKRPGF